MADPFFGHRSLSEFLYDNLLFCPFGVVVKMEFPSLTRSLLELRPFSLWLSIEIVVKKKKSHGEKTQVFAKMVKR